MEKLAIIINGRPGSGKDSLCDAVIKQRRAGKISSIDPIADIARKGGWDGIKSAASRKLLSDLKRIFSEYNDLPNRYVLEKYHEFLQSGDDILFIHIREKDQIEDIQNKIFGRCVTLLIRRPGTEMAVGNPSDDEVEQFPYDFSYNNDKPLDQSESDFIELCEKLYSGSSSESAIQ